MGRGAGHNRTARAREAARHSEHLANGEKRPQSCAICAQDAAMARVERLIAERKLVQG